MLLARHRLVSWIGSPALLLSLLLLDTNPSLAQKNTTRLPFRLVNNLIVLSSRINGSDTLHLILDTGLKNSIICELNAGEILELEEAREIRVMGLGEGSPVEAIHSGGNVLEIGNMEFPDQDFVVLSNTFLQMSNKMGTRIHGMLGMKAFGDYVLSIDYERRFLSLSSAGSFKLPRNGRYTSLPLQIESGRPFLEIIITTENGSSWPVKLLLDSGASNALWLDSHSLEGFTIPEGSRYCYLGCGISGEVHGLMSRMQRVDIGKYSLSDVIVSYPDSLSIIRDETVKGRNGSLGSEIIKRFNVCLDFPGRQIHLLPNHSFEKLFHYDMSGIEVIADVPDLPAYTISRVREGSTAHLAGARAGDKIHSINNVPVRNLNLDDVYRNLEGREGKKVRMVLQRGDEKFKISFLLEEYI
jgi:hypothetical protein